MHLGVCNHESHMKPCTCNILCKLTPLFYRGEDGLLQGIPDIAIDSQELLKLHSFKPALVFVRRNEVCTGHLALLLGTIGNSFIPHEIITVVVWSIIYIYMLCKRSMRDSCNIYIYICYMSYMLYICYMLCYVISHFCNLC